MTEDDIQKLSRELIDFTKELEKFNRNPKNPKDSTATSTEQNTDDKKDKKISENFDKSTQKIVNALGALSAALTNNDTTKTKETAYIDKFTKSIEKATDAQEEKKKLDDKVKVQEEENLAHLEKVLDWQKKTSEEQKRLLAENRVKKEKDEAEAAKAKAKKEKDDEREELGKKISSLTRAKDSNRLSESLLNARTAGDVFSSRLAETSTLTQVGFAGLNAAVKGATDGLKSYASAVYKGERGAAVGVNAAASLVTPFVELGKTVGSAMVALGTLASWVGRFIPGWGTATAVLGKGAAVAGAALYSVAKTAELYIELQKLGAEQTNKLFKSYQTLSQSGLSTAKGMDDVYRKVHQLGMSVSEIENFTKLLTNGSKSLALFGGTASEGAAKFSEFAGDLVTGELGESLRMLGVTADDQRDAAMLYMSIQAKTGQIQDKTSKDLVKGTANLVKEMDQMAQLTGASVEEQKKAAEAVMAEDRFQAAMDDARSSGDKVRITELENAKLMHDLLYDMGNTQAAKAALQYAAGGFSSQIGGEFAMQYLGGREIRGDKKLSKEEAISTLSGNLNQSIEQGRGLRQFLPDAKIPGIELTAGATAITERERMKSMLAMKEKNPGMTIDEILERDQQARIDQGDRLKAQVKAGILQDKAAQLMDSAVYKFSNAAQISQWAAEKFDTVAEKFGDYLGVDKSTYAKKSEQSSVVPPTAENTRPNGAIISHDIKGDSATNLKIIKAAMMKRGEKDENYLTAALANVMKESGGVNQVENLERYANTDNARIKEIFGSRASSMSTAELNKTKANPKLFAEAMYGGEWGKKNLGNMTPDDAWTYRGRGYIQITGKSNYAAASRAIYKDDRLVKNPDLITEDSEVSAAVTAWFFERGKRQLAKPMGISENNMSRRDAAILTTSIVAGGDIRKKKDYIKNDLLNKVEGYASKKEIQDIKPPSVEKDLKQPKPDWAKEPASVTPANPKEPAKVEPAKPVVTKETAKVSSSTNSDSIPDKSKTASMVKSKDEALALLNFSNEDTGKRENFLQMDGDVQQKVLAAAAEYNQQTGSKLQINSAKRSFADQKRLYDDYVSGRSNIEAAEPGTSRHESGRAVDIQQGKDGDSMAIAALNRQGLNQEVKDDPVHFQARTGGIFKGPSTGYNVELHGEEAVVPANEGVSKQALNPTIFNQNDTIISDLTSMFEKMNEKYDTMIELLANGNEYSEKLVAATV